MWQYGFRSGSNLPTMWLCSQYVRFSKRKKKKEKRKDKTGHIIIGLIAILALFAVGMWQYNNYTNEQAREKQREKTRLSLLNKKNYCDYIAYLEAAVAEKARQDAIEAARVAAQVHQDSIKRVHRETVNLYLSKVREFRNTEEGEGGEYFLYDITGDGVPELWTSSTFGYGGSYVYTYHNNGLKLIYTGAGGHSGYYMGNRYVIEQFAHMGYEVITKLTWHRGKIVETVLFESEEEVSEYHNISEPMAVTYDISDETPITSMF